MIILTGHQGFIGKKFLKELQSLDKEIMTIEMLDSWYFQHSFDDWDDIELIIHQGALSSTIETDVRKIYHRNII